MISRKTEAADVIINYDFSSRYKKRHDPDQHGRPLLSEERLNKSLKENTTITIGRLGLMCPEQVL